MWVRGAESLLCHVCGADRTNGTGAVSSVLDGKGKSPISCGHEDKGIPIECKKNQPFCLMIASNVCIGTRQPGPPTNDNTCNQDFFYCWQKGCGNLDQIREQFLPPRIPGCKYLDHPTSEHGVDVRRTLVCVCDTDLCNSDLADLTGSTLPAIYKDQPYRNYEDDTGLQILKDAATETNYKIWDTENYRPPSDWEKVFLTPYGPKRDEAIANILNKKPNEPRPKPLTEEERRKLEPGVSHDLQDRSLKISLDSSSPSPHPRHSSLIPLTMILILFSF
ncbi:unnamed protein product [Notodromas monacha]|uniref:Uncharacterized protein n=1 Tax=Notodromas monacha TaxID=399045 RepID=A0A7R9BVG0_9CRUS|nr:unnamed protein product [Notodromas monacha]CAG0921133.1 unnamed protein product [Notodromas monacha]